MRSTGSAGKFSKSIAVLALSVVCAAESIAIAALNTGASFLRVGVSAKATAMGEAAVADKDDVNSMLYNPATISSLKQNQVFLTHATWIGNSNFDAIGGAMPTKYGTVGFGIERLAVNVSGGRDANRNETGSYTNSDTAYTMSLSRPMMSSGLGITHLGTAFKMIESELAGYSARTYAMDAGLLHEFKDRPLTLGLSALNIGRGMNYLGQTDALPLTVSGGASYRIGGVLNVEMDVAREVYDQKTDIRVGSEYSLMPSFSLRLGYGAGQAQSTTAGGGALSAMGGLATGFGLRLGRTNLDYTFSPMAQLGSVSRVSLGYKFGHASRDENETGYTQYYFPDKIEHNDENSRVLMLGR